MKMLDGFKSRLRGWTGIQGDWSGWTWLEDRSVKLMVETSLWEANLQVLQWLLDEAREPRNSWIQINEQTFNFVSWTRIYIYLLYNIWPLEVCAWNWPNDRHSSNSTTVGSWKMKANLPLDPLALATDLPGSWREREKSCNSPSVPWIGVWEVKSARVIHLLNLN